MIVVSDTSSISALLRIGHADLLQRLYGEVLIPEAVRDELLDFFPTVPEFLHCRQVSDAGEVNRLCGELDLGEAEAIALAREMRADVLLIDELDGRGIATHEGIPIIGLMGVLATAKNEGLVVSIRPLIDKLESEADFRFSAELKQDTLRLANEL
jgi:predicted nucleic acid-binding protein